jgi:hypothetical protein
MSNLGKKRLEAALAITTYAIGSGTAAAAPTPGVEIPKQIVLTASDVAMYTTIWKIYFHEDLSSKGIVEMLSELGLVTLAATGTAYIVSKATTAIVSEIADWLGFMGWGVKAAIASSITGIFAAAWAIYCDRLAAEKEAQPV